tara:strand:+ start:1978 stop:2280 length:303 start_codon:yes stop_codon:yes gene_type:complete
MSQDKPQTETQIINENEVNTSPLLSMVVEKDSELKDYLVEYVGTKLDQENVTVEMITEVMATEFPEFVLTVAEENFLLGYQQGISDVNQLSERETGTTEQ